MNISMRWLLDMVPGLSGTAEELAEHLALRGAPVDDISSPGAGLGDIVIGKVLSAQQHPNADRLSVCEVDGGDGVVQVVCGAPNVKGETYYPFAPVGAVLPGDFKIKKAKIRGEVSQGMLCSAKELGLGADHDGILELEGEFRPGADFVAAMGLDDATLDVEITANRGDLLSHAGVAREMASEASDRIHDLLEYGVPFDRDLEGKLRASREAAHSEHRVIGVQGDRAGKAIMEALVSAVHNTPSIRLLEGFVAEDLMTDGRKVTGLLARQVGD